MRRKTGERHRGFSAARLAAAALAALLAGCNLTWHYLDEPVTDRVIEVHSGDRWYVTLNEDRAHGYRWRASSDDDDVEFGFEKIAADREDGEPERNQIEIRFHRGYDGPSNVLLEYVAPGRRHKVVRTVKFHFYKRTGDVAPWK